MTRKKETQEVQEVTDKQTDSKETASEDDNKLISHTQTSNKIDITHYLMSQKQSKLTKKTY